MKLTLILLLIGVLFISFIWVYQTVINKPEVSVNKTIQYSAPIGPTQSDPYVLNSSSILEESK